jgi:pimeloyl-ACP methyl ester carboxylesterase
MTRGDERPARLVFVAHSMGGLLVRALALPDVDGALADDIRAVVTVGTPFRGAAKAVLLLNTGTGAPLPRRRLRDLARTLPGLYDLLPTYRCVDLGDDVAALSPSDVEGLGGDEELAQQSADLHTRLRQVTIPGHRQVVGLGQTTPSSLVVDGGVYHARSYSFDVHGDGSLVRDEQGVLRRIERHGDGTVPRNSAELIRGTGSPPQQHGALARTREVLRAVRGVLTESEYGGELGDGLLGLDVPDLVQAGAAWTITVTNPRRPTCVIVDTEADREVARLPIGRRDGVYQADGPNLAPGLYRIQVHSDGSSPVSQIVLIFDP